MKQFFIKIGHWFKDHAPTRRRIVQLYVALLYNANIKGFINSSIYTGNTKYACLPGFNCYSCPGAIGTCPLGALQNSLESSSVRTPYYVIGCIMLFGLICGRSICGWLCPVGMLQEFAYKVKTPKVKKSKWTRIASYLKYVILGIFVITIPIMYGFIGQQIPAFCKYICPVGTFEGSIFLMASNMSDMGPLFTWKFSLLMAFIVCSMFFYRFFCRFFCPLGAIYGFFNKIALFGIDYDPQTCTNCGLCLDKCKMDIKHVGDHECISCGECIPVCPVNAIRWKGEKFFLAPNAVETPLPERKLNLAAMVAKPTENTEAATSIETAPIKKERIRPEAITKKPKARRKLKKGWAIGLGVGMTAVLATAIVYFNFIDVNHNDVMEIGMLAPDATFDLVKSNGEMKEEGTTWTISDHYGTPTILNFWYTDCSGCKAEMPDFEEFYDKYQNECDLIILDSIDSRKDCADYIRSNNGGVTWSTMMNDFGMDYNAAYASKFNISGYPLTVILDSDGYIQGIETNSINLNILEGYATQLGFAK